MVILVHSRQKFDELFPFMKIFDIGQMGCQMFFVIAGFTSMMSYGRLREAKQNHAAWKFYKRRFSAIIPGWYASILLVYILNTISLAVWETNIGFGTNRHPLSVVCNLLFLHGLLPFCNNNVTGGGWFLGTLVIFYLAVPFCYRFMAKIRQRFVKYIPWLVEMAAVVCITGLYILTREKRGYAVLANNGFIYFSFINQMGCFLLGASLYFEKRTENVVADRILSVLDAILLLYVFFSGWKLAFVLAPFLMGLLTYHLIKWMLHAEGNCESKFGKSRIVRVLKAYGSSSYHIYLVHCLFVWSMPIAVQKILLGQGLEINGNLLYLFLIVPMFVLSYAAALLLDRMLRAVKEKYHKS